MVVLDYKSLYPSIIRTFLIDPVGMIEGIHHIEEASARIENIQNSVLENLENISASTEENAAGTQEVSANAEEVLATMDEFTNHVADLRDIAEELKRLTNRFEVEK